MKVQLYGIQDILKIQQRGLESLSRVLAQVVGRLESIEDRVVVLPEWPEELIRAEEEAKQAREAERVQVKGKGKEIQQEASRRADKNKEESEEPPKKRRRSPQLEETRGYTKDKMRAPSESMKGPGRDEGQGSRSSKDIGYRDAEKGETRQGRHKQPQYKRRRI
ncbi:hypothetical protein BDZ91DRAFT_759195 [Kalaharituber pfeilii]|nr:hypothetical protein BDZ91DRAFT_759195 [Kalaharituber pfeilii]